MKRYLHREEKRREEKRREEVNLYPPTLLGLSNSSLGLSNTTCCTLLNTLCSHCKSTFLFLPLNYYLNIIFNLNYYTNEISLLFNSCKHNCGNGSK